MNRGPADYESAALPTELPRRCIDCSIRPKNLSNKHARAVSQFECRPPFLWDIVLVEGVSIYLPQSFRGAGTLACARKSRQSVSHSQECLCHKQTESTCSLAASPSSFCYDSCMNESPHPAPALIVIDVQRAFDEWEAAGQQRNNPDAIRRIAELLAAFRAWRPDIPCSAPRHSARLLLFAKWGRADDGGAHGCAMAAAPYRCTSACPPPTDGPGRARRRCGVN